MKQLLFDALKGCPADYAEIRYEELDGSSFGYRGKDLETASTARNTGGMIRVCVNGGWGTYEFATLDRLKEKVWEACANAALIGKEKTVLAELPPIPDIFSEAHFVRDFRGISFSDKLDLIRNYSELILQSDKQIESCSVNYSERFRCVHFASTRGIYHYKQLPLVVLAMSAIARDGDQVQTSSDSFASVDDYSVVLNREEKALEIAQRAVALLKAPKCEGGKHTVILRPDFAGVFIHEAFGHLSEADFLYENDKMRDLMKIGRKVGVEELNVVDDGTLEGMVGTQVADDEGTPPQCTQLIKNGVLAGHLHSLETAGKMGAKPTGNARTVKAIHTPIVRMTNTYIQPGSQTKDELFAGVKDGIYACGLYGGQTMMEMFTFSASHAYRIHNGQLGELVRDVVMSGNVFDTLNSIDGIANDLEIHNRGGGCGKGGQYPLPVTFGGPHIRIQDVLIGG